MTNKQFNRCLITMIILMLFLVFIYIPLAFAGRVQDNNNGEKGNILIHSGDINGKQNDIGTWVDIKDVPELKGEKGDTGTTGTQGIQGEQGIQGIQGITGQNGIDGINGADGKDGKTGAKGDTGKQGERGLQGRGLENRYEVIGEIRLTDTRKTSISIYGGYDVHNEVGITGVKFTWKMGKSYEERKIEDLKIENKLLSYEVDGANQQIEELKRIVAKMIIDLNKGE